MSLLEDETVAFVVRIWREPSEQLGSTPEWRGTIEHVGGGKRLFFRDLNAMEKFILPYLEQIGIDPSQRFWEHVDPLAPDKPYETLCDFDTRDEQLGSHDKPIPRR